MGSWKRSEPPLLVDTDTPLYGQVDGATPKYIDRGWLASLYAYDQQGGSTISVVLHDMGTPESAAAIFNLDLPVSRIAINEIPDPQEPRRKSPMR